MQQWNERMHLTRRGHATHPASATVRTALDHHVFALNIENLVLIGKASLDATGNGSANTLDGKTGANRLSGLAGNDSIDGGAGKHILIGGAGTLKGSAGADAFVFAFGDTAATSFAGLPLTIE
jgi:Ca2+-binding RTX toxin-like protein